ncbi:hypothetical protein CLV30_12581 [Haloactinopolyspora alba]|uniref:Uncharacterized protein n=1 Tax=Haloactinopolyspora alba TaxID=648780 RepID=A0A2P8DHN9_9ACTN|nr:hypothetical protein [Haloactinopolyspora alba]PSK96699.1 hypothetical protein CLV30_12581 [Haloactinopolyspora alba]
MSAPKQQSKWVEVTHEKHKGTTRVPNRPAVLADFAKRGWKPKPAPTGSGSESTKG